MQTLDRRKLLLGSLLLATAGAAELYVPTRKRKPYTDKQFNALVPGKVADWSYYTDAGLILPPEDQLSKRLYEQLLTRVYIRPKHDPVMLLLAYSSVQEGRLQVHRPEVCYPAAGFTITSSQDVEVPVVGNLTMPCKFLVAERNERRECVLYWTRVGNAMPQRWSGQRIEMARANLAGYIPDGLLGRISMVSDPKTALPELVAFVGALVAGTAGDARRMLVGERT